jgi:hypothetical protein
MPIWIRDLLLSLILRLIERWAADAAKEYQDARDQAQLDEARGIRNDKNAKAYREAKSRQDKIRAMLDLANRNNT